MVCIGVEELGDDVMAAGSPLVEHPLARLAATTQIEKRPTALAMSRTKAYRTLVINTLDPVGRQSALLT